jgi:hypothetical protein
MKSTRRGFRTPLLCVLALAAGGSALAQSTLGTILGSAKDPSGAVIPRATTTLTNTGVNTTRTRNTTSSGLYEFTNLEPGTYSLRVKAEGFSDLAIDNIVVLARDTQRVDAVLSVKGQSVEVEVREFAGDALVTDLSNLAETKTGRELVDLPVAIATRGAGSTSPLSALTAQPAVQTDASGNISVAGTSPNQLSITLDGISSMGARNPSIITELFPSFSGIAEITVSETTNPAEFGGVSDITTVSKSGNGQFHGGIFYIHQNRELTARDTFSANKPALVLNDFGGYLGGPLPLPRLGRDKSFFFMDYESLRYPKQTVVIQSVPSLAYRSGDLSSVAAPIFAPGGTPLPGNIIPDNLFSQISKNILQYFFPLPNLGSPNSVSNNFTALVPSPISSDQGDIRLDEILTTRQRAFARYTYKGRSVTTASPTSFLNGPTYSNELDWGITGGHIYILSPRVINELRLGGNGSHAYSFFNRSATLAATQVGNIDLLPHPLPAGSLSPNVSITGFQSTGGNNSNSTKQQNLQLLDNVTWSKGGHTVKFGADIRYIQTTFTNALGGQRIGVYTFNGAVTNAVIGNPFAAFLLGVPDATQVSSQPLPDADVHSFHQAYFIQDNWKITPSLTLSYGLRWEYHPMFVDSLHNIGTFLPTYTSVVNGQTVNGTVVIADNQTPVNPLFGESIYPTPVLTAKEAGIPSSLRYSSKRDFNPRIGFAWRPFRNGKTVVRGGYGRFTITLLGSLSNAGWGQPAGYIGVFQQTFTNKIPTLTFPYPFPAELAQPGVQSFNIAEDTRYQDPYVQQWNFTLEHQVRFGAVARVSYVGSNGSNLWLLQNLDQIPANTIGFAKANANRPFPLWAVIQYETNGGWSNYDALQTELNKRFTRALQFQASYVYLRNLANNGGNAPSAFPSERGGFTPDRFNPGLDYGNVAYSRRHRVLGTFLYELPFGRGKQLLRNANPLVDLLIGGWRMAGVLVFQSGPFLTPTVAGADPSGTGFAQLVGPGRADTVRGVSVYPETQTLTRWLNPAAFAVPTNNIGRFGNASVGSIVGPGTQTVALSLIKSVRLAEATRLEFGAQAANIFNHPNYSPPNTSVNTAAFGSITSLQTAEGAGPRSIQLTGRITF